ncbi:MAG: hypothetical protein ABWX98_07745, partial [Lacisediminihabitans sp.]
QSAFSTRPWLFWWPAAFIVLLALCVNFVGDGLRDAFDPQQRRFSLRRTKENDEVSAAQPLFSDDLPGGTLSDDLPTRPQ